MPVRSRIPENVGRREAQAAQHQVDSLPARAGPMRHSKRGKPAPARPPKRSRAVARIQDEATGKRHDPKWSALAAIVATNARCASRLVAPSVPRRVVVDIASAMFLTPAGFITTVIRN